MADVFQIVTDKILNLLQMGEEIPWHRPWCTVAGGAFNRISGKQYSLLNQMMLTHSGEYATFGQWTKLGGKIRKGEKSEIVVFWKWPEEETKKDPDEDDQDQKRKGPVLRFYRVFHISQVDGVAPLEPRIKIYNHDPIEQAEKLVHGNVIREGIRLEDEQSNTAYYSPAQDVIHIPSLWQYEYPEEYYSTALHEIVHSTGHVNRLNRPGLQTVAFGSETYSKEELVAEIACACLMSYLGIQSDRSIRNSAGYVQGWLRALQDYKRMIVFAAGQAEKAVRYILGEQMTQVHVA